MAEHDESTGGPSEKAIQARIDLHQAILREYRVRSYQMVLTHAALAIAAGRYAAGKPWQEWLAVGIAVSVVTALLWVWLRRLMDKCDGHRDDALGLYRRLGVGIARDLEHASSKDRLWIPLIQFPVGLTVGLWIWLIGAALAEG